MKLQSRVKTALFSSQRRFDVEKVSLIKDSEVIFTGIPEMPAPAEGFVCTGKVV